MLDRLRDYCSIIFDRFGFELACLAAFLIPIRLIFCYWVLVPLISLWLLKPGKKCVRTSSLFPSIPEAFLIFITTLIVLSSLGRDPWNSLDGFFSLLLFSMTIFTFRDLCAGGKGFSILSFLMLGQTLSSINSVLAASFPNYVPRLLIGKVSESGQIAMTLIVGVGLILHQKRQAAQSLKSLDFWPMLLISILLATILGTLAFSPDANGSSIVIVALSLISVITILTVWIRGHRKEGWRFYFSLQHILLISLPFLFITLLSNLKRGPWAGVLVSSFIFFSIYARKFVVPLIILATLILTFIEPVRTRLLHSQEDFFIAGGRSEIWDIGMEFIKKYPLGVGYKNSRLLQQYTTEVPPELKHFHNNFLNITAETGFLGLCVFLWWLFYLLFFAFRSSTEPILSRAIGCAILSWQVAGGVEYNFGDSEVLIVALMLIGILSGFQKIARDREITACEARLTMHAPHAAI